MALPVIPFLIYLFYRKELDYDRKGKKVYSTALSRVYYIGADL
jgi:hypothetical protein